MRPGGECVWRVGRVAWVVQYLALLLPFAMSMVSVVDSGVRLPPIYWNSSNPIPRALSFSAQSETRWLVSRLSFSLDLAIFTGSHQHSLSSVPAARPDSQQCRGRHYDNGSPPGDFIALCRPPSVDIGDIELVVSWARPHYNRQASNQTVRKSPRYGGQSPGHGSTLLPFHTAAVASGCLPPSLHPAPVAAPGGIGQTPGDVKPIMEPIREQTDREQDARQTALSCLEVGVSCTRTDQQTTMMVRDVVRQAARLVITYVFTVLREGCQTERVKHVRVLGTDQSTSGHPRTGVAAVYGACWRGESVLNIDAAVPWWTLERRCHGCRVELLSCRRMAGMKQVGAKIMETRVARRPTNARPFSDYFPSGRMTGRRVTEVMETLCEDLGLTVVCTVLAALWDCGEGELIVLVAIPTDHNPQSAPFHGDRFRLKWPAQCVNIGDNLTTPKPVTVRKDRLDVDHQYQLQRHQSGVFL
ncbi:hypothetical protein BaRGS_00017249, partial [Batillaria attramentaria]